jgi:hypothetical protein
LDNNTCAQTTKKDTGKNVDFDVEGRPLYCGPGEGKCPRQVPYCLDRGVCNITAEEDIRKTNIKYDSVSRPTYCVKSRCPSNLKFCTDTGVCSLNKPPSDKGVNKVRDATGTRR